MSQQRSNRIHTRRRFFALIFMLGLSVGLVLLITTFAGRAYPVNAESATAPLAPHAAQLEVGKEGPDDIYTGRTITYTIKITNNRGSTINNVVVTDTWIASEDGGPAMPAEFNGNYWTSAPPFVSAFTYTLPSEANQSGIAVWNLSPLANGFNGTIEFTMTAPPDLQPLDVYYDRYDVGPSVLGNSVKIYGDSVTVNEPDQVVTAILGPVLILEKIATTEPGVGPRPGRLITYSLRLHNQVRQDSAPATGIKVWEILPAALIYEGAWADVGGTAVDFDPNSRHITWTLPSAFTLNPGETTTVTFATRLSTTQAWQTRITNEKEMCWAISDELINPVKCYSKLDVTTLGIFDKTYVTEPSNLNPTYSYPNRYITYTVYVFNPLSQTVASNLRITDVMPPTWHYVEMVDGPDPDWPSGEITNTMAWHWSGDAIQPNGVLSFTFVAHIGPDTPVKAPYKSCGKGALYYNDLAGSANEFPIVYEYGHSPSCEYKDCLAQIAIIRQIKLDKSVTPTKQVAGEVVTYTATLENVGDRTVNGIIFTDTLPTYFDYQSMVSGPEPIKDLINTIVWNIGTLAPGEKFELIFRAVADGELETYHYNKLDGHSPETEFCPYSTAPVEVLSPIVFNKEAIPSWDSDEWVVQGEWFQYTVEFWNRSQSFEYTIDQFEDQLYDGFEANGSQTYIYDISPPFSLQTDEQNSWEHTFRVDTPGYGSGTAWCDGLLIDEGGYNENKNRELRQEEGTFGVRFSGTDFWAWNGEKAGKMLFKPHVDLRQIVYPNRVGLGGIVEVDLYLYNNMRNHHDGAAQAVENIAVTYNLPAGFSFIEMNPDSPAPDSQTETTLTWNDIDLPAGEGATASLHFYLQAPFDIVSKKGSASAVPGDPSICIPHSEARYEVVRGVEISKIPHPASTGPFGIVEYELELINRTTAPVTGIIVTDTLPSDFEFVSVVEGYSEPDSTDPLVWRDLSVNSANPLTAAPGKYEIRFKARASGLFGLYYNMAAGFSDSTYVTHTKDYLEDVEVAVLPGVALYKTVSSEKAEAGETVVYTLTVDNRSDTDIAGVRITDTLPPDFDYQGMITGASPVTTTPEVIWTMDSVPSWEKVELVFSVLIGDQIPSDTYCNQASATAHEADNPAADVTIPDTDLAACIDVKGIPTVVRSKTPSPREVRAGNLVTYTITLYNETDQTQTLRITDTLPVSLTYESAVGSTPEPVQTSPVVWDNLQVGSLQTATLIFRAYVDFYARSGTYYNQLEGATESFKLPLKRFAPLKVEENPRYDLQVTKSDGAVTTDEGEILQYTITYTNVNDAFLSLTSVTITDTFSPLPPYAEPAGLGGDWVQVAPNLYTHFVGDLAAGESGSIQFSLQLSDTIPASVWVISNTVEISHDTDEPAIETVSNNNRSTDLDILRGPDLLVTDLEISPIKPQKGKPTTFSVTVRNQGKDATTNAFEGQFIVELYLKGTGFTPAGPPKDVFDHVGGWWPDASHSQERTSYTCISAGLSAGSEATCTFVITDITEPDDYNVYVQADVSFNNWDGAPWGNENGAVLEAIELNNIFAFGTVHIGVPNIYLPIIAKNY